MIVKRLAASIAVVGMLGGCAQVQAVYDSPTVQNVQAAVLKGCSYVPTAATVVSIVSAAMPGLNTATAIASAICQALQSTPKAAPGQPPVQPVIRAPTKDIPIEGFYTS